MTPRLLAVVLLALPGFAAADPVCLASVCTYEQAGESGWTCDATSCSSNSWKGSGATVDAADSRVRVGRFESEYRRNAGDEEACGQFVSNSRQESSGVSASIESSQGYAGVAAGEREESAWRLSCDAQTNETFARQGPFLGAAFSSGGVSGSAAVEAVRQEKGRDGMCVEDAISAGASTATAAGPLGAGTGPVTIACGALP